MIRTDIVDAEDEGDGLLTIDQAADYLAIPKATIYTWRTRRVGFGPVAIKFGGSLRFRRSDLDRWILDHVEHVGDGAPSAERGGQSSGGHGTPMTRRRRRRG